VSGLSNLIDFIGVDAVLFNNFLQKSQEILMLCVILRYLNLYEFKFGYKQYKSGELHPPFFVTRYILVLRFLFWIDVNCKGTSDPGE